MKKLSVNTKFAIGISLFVAITAVTAPVDAQVLNAAHQSATTSQLSSLHFPAAGCNGDGIVMPNGACMSAQEYDAQALKRARLYHP